MDNNTPESGRSYGPAIRPDIGEIRRKHPKAYDRWTPEADAQLVEAFQAGRSIAELARDFARQPSAIESRLKKLAFDMLRRRELGPRGDPAR